MLIKSHVFTRAHPIDVKGLYKDNPVLNLLGSVKVKIYEYLAVVFTHLWEPTLHLMQFVIDWVDGIYAYVMLGEKEINQFNHIFSTS